MKKLATPIFALAMLAVASKASANPPDLQGSDTLEGMTRDLVLSDCRSFLPDPPNPPNTVDPNNNAQLKAFLNYIGGGSGTASSAMLDNLSATGTSRQVAGPMSRAISAAECSQADPLLLAKYPGGGGKASVQGLVIGLDGIVIVGDNQNTISCGGGHTQHSDDQTAGPVFPNMPLATGTWKSKLTLLFTGVQKPGTILTDDIRDCATPERLALAADYKSLFEGGCSDASVCPGGIRHAFRRGDVSGTTDTFLALIGAPAVKRDPATLKVVATPFCNGLEYEDRDPIRRTCSAIEQVCEYDGTLGLVLPIVPPTATQEVTALYNAANTSNPAESPLYYNRDPAPNGDVAPVGRFEPARAPICAGAANPLPDPTGTLPVAGVGVVGYNLPVVGGTQQTFPNNSLRCDCRFPVPNDYTSLGYPANHHFDWNVRISNGCPVPVHPNPDGTYRWGVLNGDNGTSDNTPASWGNKFPQIEGGVSKVRCCRTTSPPAAIKFTKEDPRLINLVPRWPCSNAQNNYAAACTQNGVGLAIGSAASGANPPPPAFYRIHSSQLGLTVIGVAAQVKPEGCQEIDATRQIACLVNFDPASPCSYGFAGREAADSASRSLTAEPFNIGGISPSIVNIQKLVSTDPTVRAAAYPLSRKLYYNTLIGFGKGPLVNPNGAATSYETAQFNLYKCFADRKERVELGISAAEGALDDAGFVELPGGPKICNNMCTTNTSCTTLDPVPAAHLLPDFVP